MITPYFYYHGVIAIRIQKHITVTSQWAQWGLKSPASRLFTLQFIQVQIKENIEVPRHWPLRGWIPAQMASNAENISIWWRHHDLLYWIDQQLLKMMPINDYCCFDLLSHTFLSYCLKPEQGSFWVWAQPVRDDVTLTSSLVGWAHTQNDPCL